MTPRSKSTRAKKTGVKPGAQKTFFPTERRMEELFEQVSYRITPLPQEARKEKQFALKLVGLLEKALADEESVKVFFVGSTARDTGLRGDRDIDLFVAFKPEHSRDYIVEKTVAVTRSTIPGKWEMHYAEHPYLQARLGEYKVEVIPCFQIGPHEKIKSAVDRSPLHMDYLQKRLNETQKRDVRLLKQLMKRAGIYGAEARIGGFSGLVCEYLILNYRSLAGLLEAAAGWKPPVVIDFEGSRRGEELKSSFSAPLVIIDAIDRSRNAAAAVTAPNLSAFISFSHAFLASPSEQFFFTPPKLPPSPDDVLKLLRQRRTEIHFIEFPAPKVVEDILYPQLRKTLDSVCSLLLREGFQVVGSADFIAESKAYFLIEFGGARRPAVKVFSGPPAWAHSDVQKFLKAHPKPLRGPYIREEKVVLEESQQLLEASRFLEQLVSSKGKGASIGSKLQPAFARSRLLSEKEIASLGSEALSEIANYLMKKEFWL